MGVSAAFGGIKPLAKSDLKGKGLNREKQNPKKKFLKKRNNFSWSLP